MWHAELNHRHPGRAFADRDHRRHAGAAPAHAALDLQAAAEQQGAFAHAQQAM
jgi:hypothetical protein